MNSVLMAKIESLPIDKQKEVETFVQFLVERYAPAKPIESSIMDKRRKGFESLSANVFSSTDFDEKPDEIKKDLQASYLKA
jgi:uncharacterized protein with von Willebrand factor type A (vWA) domain